MEMLELPISYVLSDIAEVIEHSLPVRREATRARGDYAPGPEHPITGPEMRAFLAEFVSPYHNLGEELLSAKDSNVVQVPAALYDSFLTRILQDAGHPNWLNAEGPHYVRITKHLPEIRRRKSSDIPVQDKTNPLIDSPVLIHAPSLNVLTTLFRRGVDLNALSWRQLEELIAELLKTEGYNVERGRGSKDGGADIIAEMTIPTIGYMRTIWQAKHQRSGNKVGLSVVRELADVRNELNATKGFIVTSSYLTRGALERVRRDEYQLGKIERPDLEAWINKTLGGVGT